MEVWGSLAGFWWVIPLVILVVCWRQVLRFFGVLIVPEDALGLVNKKFRLLGKHRTLPDGRIVALQGEAGWQADTLAPGLHWGYWPWQYEVDLQNFITIPNHQIGVVESRDGVPIPSGSVLARSVPCDAFQNARAFLSNGGQRGPQLAVIPPGTYRINTALFHVGGVDQLEIKENSVGIVTTKEGKALASGDIAGRETDGHDMFQNPEAFIANGGFKGLQTQVILAGRYFLNPLFATVELKPMTEIAIAHVGVVISYVGSEGKDVTGDAFKHGNIVLRGQRGVWIDPLDPGKYPINPYTHRVELVPTANVVLNWATGKTESHKLDEKLSTITVRSSDGFKFNLDVSQIIHVPRNDAPRVIARFGNMANLVTQVLEPTIGNYFRNAAQSSDVISFLRERTQRQKEAREAISAALSEYNVNAVDTLIGDINPPEELMKTLTDRKLAEQEKVTYDTQKLAEDRRKELEQARATAATQARVVDAERKVAIADFDAQSRVKAAEGEAKSKTLNAEADARVLTLTGEAEATKINAIGAAEAEVIKRKIDSMEAGGFVAVEVARALSASGTKWVPDIVAGQGSGSSPIVDILVAQLVADRAKSA